jgi:parallel beta-helix repeat protein
MSVRFDRWVVVAFVLVVSVTAPVATVTGYSEEQFRTESGATEPTPVDSCTTISESGRYLLTEDIENGGGTRISRACVRINASNVVFDGDDHRISGRGVSNTTGIVVTAPDATNVTVTDLHVSEWHRGIDYGRSHCGRLSGVTATNNTYGVYLERTAGIRMSDSEINQNIVGIEAVRWVTRLTDVQVTGNHGKNIHREFPSLGQLLGGVGC